MTAAVTVGSFSSHSDNGTLEGIELARAIPMGGVLRGRIEILPDRLPANVEMPLDLADGPVLGPVEPVQVVDLFGASAWRVLFRYAAESAARPEGCCLQDGAGRAMRGGSASITQICAGAELLFARWAAPEPTSQTCAAECFRSRAEVLFARLQQPPLAVAELLLLAVLVGGGGMFSAGIASSNRDCGMRHLRGLSRHTSRYSGSAAIFSRW